MKYIEDNIVLLGLVATTVPFKYENNTVSANFSMHIEKVDLENARKELENMLLVQSITDSERIELQDEIYIINKIMESLGMR